MPNIFKNLFLFILKVSVFIFVWVLLSFYFPRFSFEEAVVTATPVIVSPTLEPLIIPTLNPANTLMAKQSLEVPATVTARPVASTALPTGEPLRALEVVVDNTQKGVLLTVSGGLENYHYRLGPLAKGAYALGPNQHFLVYVTNGGTVYINRLGETHFQKVEVVKHSFSALNKHVDPSFELSFHDTGYVYILFIYEGRYGETVQVILPRTITHF